MDTQALANHRHLLQRAWQALSLDCLSEIELLYETICSEGKIQHLHPTLTGLPSWSRNLRRERDNVTLMLLELDPEGITRANSDLSEDQNDERLHTWLSKEGNKKLPPKLEASIITLNRAALHWSILKHHHYLRCVSQTFLSTTKDTRKEKLSPLAVGIDRARLQRTLKEQSKVDVAVVDGGYSWICVRSIGEDRLARQMTDAGWSWGDYDEGDQVDVDEWEDMPFVSHVQRVVDASRLNRWEYVFPKIILILPGIDLTTSRLDIKVLLSQLHRLDPQVNIIIHDATSPLLITPPPAPPIAIKNLLGDPHAGLTPTLNLDHTILIDLISDITHLQLEPQAWQAPTTRTQIEEELRHDGGIMASTLYPLLQGRRLECTREAAEHFHEVLRTVGTDTERARGRILVPNPSAPTETPTSAHEAFNALSSRPAPATVQLPVHICPDVYTMEHITHLTTTGNLPAVAVNVCNVARNFPAAKRSVYMHGWATANATLTSNKEISGQMKTWVEAGRTKDDERGPLIWRVDVTRNLLAKSATPPNGWRVEENSSPRND